jgi:hypothetical protein
MWYKVGTEKPEPGVKSVGTISANRDIKGHVYTSKDIKTFAGQDYIYDADYAVWYKKSDIQKSTYSYWTDKPGRGEKKTVTTYTLPAGS